MPLFDIRYDSVDIFSPNQESEGTAATISSEEESSSSESDDSDDSDRPSRR